MISEKPMQEERSKLKAVLTSFNEFILLTDNEELKQIIKDLLTAVDDPFMFVIVGEVKSGKSSFINALLDTGEEICKVAASPMTDTIQQIVYGTQKQTTQISDHIKRISLNEEILKHIAIVDTPGTNTIIQHHQELTESFIPSSDLIVFVFESKNPYRQSAWDFFDYIHKDWHKKIIFVLQQKDLMSVEDLHTNIEGVSQHARQKGIMDPKVFAVSAKHEIEGRKEDSGFRELRDYITGNITGKQASAIKLLNIIDTSTQLKLRISDALKVRKEQLELDKDFRKDIQLALDQQEIKARRYAQMLIENLTSCYQRVMKNKKGELKDNIGFFSLLKRSLGSMVGSSKSLKEWLNSFSKDIEEQLNKEFNSRLNDGIEDISDSIQDMGHIVDTKIRKSKTILKEDHDVFADIATKRRNVLKDLNSKFTNFLENPENFYSSKIGDKTKAIVPDFAKGGGLAVIGVIVTTITNAAIFDITGGVITAIGLSFAGISLGINKRNIIKSFESLINVGSHKIEHDLSKDISDYTEKIRKGIEDNFYRFDVHIESEEKSIHKMEEDIDVISSSINEQRARLEGYLS